MLTLEGVSPPPKRGKIAKVLGFARPWAYGLGSAAYLFSAGWIKWKNRAAIVQLSRHFGYSYDTREPAVLPQVAASALAPADSLLDVREIDAIDGNVSERELITLCRLVWSRKPQRIFEIGTFDGRTTLNLAANSLADSRVFTLDLPREKLGEVKDALYQHEVRYADKSQSGARFSGSEMASRIEQLYGDSATFGFTSYYDTIDFVFIDGSHRYEYVVNDSLHALRMLRNGKGMIVWHDYGRWDGVTRALNDLRRTRSEFSAVASIAGTTLAVVER